VGLVGMGNTHPPLLLLELLDGDLYESLMDPLGIKDIFNAFTEKLNHIYVHEPSINKWEKLVASPLQHCKDLCDTIEQFKDRVKAKSELKKEADKVINQGKKYFEKRDRTQGQLWEQSHTKFLEAYASSLGIIAPLSVEGVLRITSDISHGLHYLHSLTPPLIHRDLKSPNIFLTRSLAKGAGRAEYARENVIAKLGDFGLSSMKCGPFQLQAQGKMAKINPRWTAPEILDQRRNYSIESDVYSMVWPYGKCVTES